MDSFSDDSYSDVGNGLNVDVILKLFEDKKNYNKGVYDPDQMKWPYFGIQLGDTDSEIYYDGECTPETISGRTGEKSWSRKKYVKKFLNQFRFITDYEENECVKTMLRMGIDMCRFKHSDISGGDDILFKSERKGVMDFDVYLDGFNMSTSPYDLTWGDVVEVIKYRVDDLMVVEDSKYGYKFRVEVDSFGPSQKIKRYGESAKYMTNVVTAVKHSMINVDLTLDIFTMTIDQFIMNHTSLGHYFVITLSHLNECSFEQQIKKINDQVLDKYNHMFIPLVHECKMNLIAFTTLSQSKLVKVYGQLKYFSPSFIGIVHNLMPRFKITTYTKLSFIEINGVTNIDRCNYSKLSLNGLNYDAFNMVIKNSTPINKVKLTGEMFREQCQFISNSEILKFRCVLKELSGLDVTVLLNKYHTSLVWSGSLDYIYLNINRPVIIGSSPLDDLLSLQIIAAMMDKGYNRISIFCYNIFLKFMKIGIEGMVFNLFTVDDLASNLSMNLVEN